MFTTALHVMMRGWMLDDSGTFQRPTLQNIRNNIALGMLKGDAFPWCTDIPGN